MTLTFHRNLTNIYFVFQPCISFDRAETCHLHHYWALRSASPTDASDGKDGVPSLYTRSHCMFCRGRTHYNVARLYTTRYLDTMSNFKGMRAS